MGSALYRCPWQNVNAVLATPHIRGLHISLVLARGGSPHDLEVLHLELVDGHRDEAPALGALGPRARAGITVAIAIAVDIALVALRRGGIGTILGARRVTRCIALRRLARLGIRRARGLGCGLGLGCGCGLGQRDHRRAAEAFADHADQVRAVRAAGRLAAHLAKEVPEVR